MHIEHLKITGFKSVSNLSVRDTSPFMVLAGPNGAGKSNITDALFFFGAVIQNGAARAIRDAGGFHQIHCFKSKKVKRTTISFEIKLRLDNKQFAYALNITEINKSPKLYEQLMINNNKVIDRRVDNGAEIILGESSQMQLLPDYPAEMTLLMLLGHLELYKFLTNIQVFRIDPISAKEPDASATDTSALDTHGQNVATMLSVLSKDKVFKNQVMDWIELIVPGMESVSTQRQRLDGSTMITFKEQGTKTRFPARLISDGTIYSLCIITAILSRFNEYGLTIIEEPERGIHPKAIGELVQLMRDSASVNHPIFVTTHSESVVRSSEADELWLVNKRDGKTHLKSAASSELDLQQLSLDKAWLMNLFDAGLPW